MEFVCRRLILVGLYLQVIPLLTKAPYHPIQHGTVRWPATSTATVKPISSLIRRTRAGLYIYPTGTARSRTKAPYHPIQHGTVRWPATSTATVKPISSLIRRTRAGLYIYPTGT